MVSQLSVLKTLNMEDIEASKAFIEGLISLKANLIEMYISGRINHLRCKMYDQMEALKGHSENALLRVWGDDIIIFVDTDGEGKSHMRIEYDS